MAQTSLKLHARFFVDINMYCMKCKMKTSTRNITKALSRNNRRMLKGICAVCGSKKAMFLKNVEGGSLDIHTAIGRLPKPKGGWTLPSHKYTGPYNPLHEQLDEYDNPLPGQEPYNKVDEIAMRHDICYRDQKDGKHGCDKKMLDELRD